MALESSDYAVAGVRVLPSSTEVKSVKTVTTSSSSTGGGSNEGLFRTSGGIKPRLSYANYSSTRNSKSYGSGSATSSMGATSGIGLTSGLGASCGSGTFSSSFGGNVNSGNPNHGLGSSISNEYNVRFSGTTSRDRLRNLSDMSTKQHEEAATIVTKVIREDTSEMESKIRELSVVTGEIQQTLKTLIEHSNSETMFMKEKMESFVSVTTEMKEALTEMTRQMSDMRSDIQNITVGLQACDTRLNDIDVVIDNKLSVFRRELVDRDNAIQQIKSNLERQDIELSEHTKQLSDLEEHRHALYHAEETIKQKDDDIRDLEQNMKALNAKYRQIETETVQHTEGQLQKEKQARDDTTQEITHLHQTLISIESALESERQNKKDKERDIEVMQKTIRNLEVTLDEERRANSTNSNDLAQIQYNVQQLETQLESEKKKKVDSERELLNLHTVIETLTKEKQELMEENNCIRHQSQTDVDSLTQMLEKLSKEKTEIETISGRERRKSDQLQESMTSLRMALEEEQRKAEDNERRLQSFDRVIKETKEMYAMKESEYELLREEIVHYKNLVATKEKELCNLTTVFNENMAENKHEVTTLRQEIKEYKTAIREKEFRLREYRDRELLLGAAGSTTPSSVAGSTQATNMAYTLHGSPTRVSPCRSPSPTLGYCQTHKSIVSLDSRASVGACGSSCSGHGIISVKYAEPCTKIYPTKDRHLGVTNIYQSTKGSRSIRLVDDDVTKS